MRDPTHEATDYIAVGVVIAWLTDRLGLGRNAALSASTQISADLRVAGDEVGDLVREFCAQFNMDARLLPGGNYIGPEAKSSLLARFWLISRFIRRRRISTLGPLRVSDLAALLSTRDFEKSAATAARLTVFNDSNEDLIVWVEPPANDYTLEPGESLTIYPDDQMPIQELSRDTHSIQIFLQSSWEFKVVQKGLFLACGHKRKS